jgi:hypothetical protein
MTWSAEPKTKEGPRRSTRRFSDEDLSGTGVCWAASSTGLELRIGSR